MSFVTEKILEDIVDLLEAKKTPRHENHRKKIKILFDSLFEQIIENLLGQKASGFMHARLILNTALKGTIKGNGNRLVIRNLAKALQPYDQVFSRNYVDTSQDLEDFIDELLWPLLRNISKHPKMQKFSICKGIRKK